MSGIKSQAPERVRADGCFLRAGGKRFLLRGVSYGPFRAEDGSSGFRGREQTLRDLKMISSAGFNTLRVYHVPDREFLDGCGEWGLRVMVTLPWEERSLFLDKPEVSRRALGRAREAANSLKGHSSLLGYLVDNEIPADLVRWYGFRKIEAYLNSLIETIKGLDGEALCGYGNFPPTEYLTPENADFLAFNVYLHDQKDLSSYLDRLMLLADGKPLILSEFGMDTIRHTEQEQAGLMTGTFSMLEHKGLAGGVAFAWTDEWYTDGVEVADWSMGIVQRDRTPKRACHELEHLFQKGSPEPEWQWPKVSVVVCAYQAESTLRGCLEALGEIDYPDYEVIVVNDGSTDATGEIASAFQGIKLIHQKNKGLSAARNVGMAEASGEIVAYTDADCMPAPEWLRFLVIALMEGHFDGVGGPNASPPVRGYVQAALAVAPGAPCHVMLDNQSAEHVPGCNMAFRKDVLERIGGFDPQFRKAGDDVDLCWRLIEAGSRIAYAPAAWVWHYRRLTLPTYYRQQAGYGEAEAMLRFKHPQYFDSLGTSKWSGTIYESNRRFGWGFQPLIYRGVFGLAPFQSVYHRHEVGLHPMVSGLGWIALMLFFLAASFFVHELMVIAIPMLLLFGYSTLMKTLEVVPDPKYKGLRFYLLVWIAVITQPWIREWARHSTRVKRKRTPPVSRKFCFGSLWKASVFFSNSEVRREELLDTFYRKALAEGWNIYREQGWSSWDLLIYSSRLWHTRIRSLTEIYPHGKRVIRLRFSMIPTRLCILFNMALLVFVTGIVACLTYDTYTLVFLLSGLFLIMLLQLLGIWRGHSSLVSLMNESAHSLGLSSVEEK